jgi:hypothetical protein
MTVCLLYVFQPSETFDFCFSKLQFEYLSDTSQWRIYNKANYNLKIKRIKNIRVVQADRNCIFVKSKLKIQYTSK